MMSSSRPTVSDSSRTSSRARGHVVQRDDEAVVARQRRDADLDRAIRDGRRDRVAGRRGDLEAGRRHRPDELVQPARPRSSSPTSAAKRAFASSTRARPSSGWTTADGHGAVLEREAAQVAGRWRQRAHGYANGRAVIALAAGRTSSAKRVRDLEVLVHRPRAHVEVHRQVRVAGRGEALDVGEHLIGRPGERHARRALPPASSPGSTTRPEQKAYMRKSETSRSMRSASRSTASRRCSKRPGSP